MWLIDRLHKTDLPDDECNDEPGRLSSAVTKPRTRVIWTPAERAEWLALFEKSGQSVSELCRANDLVPATLSLWRQQQAAGWYEYWGRSRGTRGNPQRCALERCRREGARHDPSARRHRARTRGRHRPGMARCVGEKS
jgi:transposase-like protein